MKKNRAIVNFVIIAGIVGMLIGMICMDWNQINSYQAYNTSTLSYVRAKVISIEGMNLVQDELDESRFLGIQDVIVEITEGSYKGEQILIRNNLSRTQNVKVDKGQRVIVCVDAPENASAYFTIFNYDRSIGMTVIFILFASLVLVIGGKKGIRALAGLAVTLAIILLFYVQGIFHGKSVLGIAVIAMTGITAATLYILNGISKKTLLATAGTFCGLVAAGVFCLVCQKLLYVSGYNLEDAEGLLLIRQNTGLEVKHLLLAGVLISALGAVMDVAVSIVAALYELVETNPDFGMLSLFRSGMNIGKDMIGTMCNTLILAFVGSSLTTLLLLLGYGYQPVQLLNSDYLAIELIQGMASTLAVVLTVPVTSIISAYFLQGVRGHEKN